MARLPQPGSDDGTWGNVLNDFLTQSHTASGTLKDDTVGAEQLKPGTITDTEVANTAGIAKTKLETAVQTSLTKADSSVQTVNGNSPTNGAVTLNAADVGALTPAAADGLYIAGTQQSGAPSNPSTNDLWYDNSNDLLKRYNGTTWVDGSGSASAVSGQELAFIEVRSGINVTNTSVNSALELGTYLNVIVPPCSRPYLVTASGILGHSTLGGVVGLRIIEISNGVDAVLARSEFHEVPGPSGTPPYYATIKPELRVPPTPRTRTFKLQYFQKTTGTVTVYTPGTDATLGNSGEWQLYMRVVAQ